MTEEEAQAYAELKELLVQKERRIQELEGQLIGTLLRVEELERRLAKDSHNSSLPPSRDHGKRTPLGQRKKSKRASGGQTGHQGHMLLQAQTPDEVISHRPLSCQACHRDLRQEAGRVIERRQVHDLPELRMQVHEHQLEVICCSSCQQFTRGTFPDGVNAPVQYGPRVQALAVYLSQFQLLPVQRTCEALSDVCQAAVSQGTVLQWIAEAAKALEPTRERLKELLRLSRLQHVDETSVHVSGFVRWVHVNSTRWLTLYSWQPKRGAEGIEAVGIIPRFAGRAVHDRWTSYDRYACAHSLCGAHLIRDAIFVAEQEKQPWAQEMVDHLLHMVEVTKQWRAQGAKVLAAQVRDPLLAQYFSILASGFAAHAAQAPPVSSSSPKKGGRKKQDPSKNLLDALLLRAEQVLSFVDDLSVPFTNNLAERDLRMIKVQQKVSGTFRSPEGASAFCTIRSYLSTMRKQARSMLDAMLAVFAGSPFPIAWAPE
jgi:transposase